KLRLFVICLVWYVRMKKVVTQSVADLRNVYLANTHANRLFVKRFQGTERYKDINFVLCPITYFGRNRAGNMVMMTTLPSTGQVITARLALGKTASEITTQARNIKTRITGNLLVPFTAPEIATLGTEINTYEDAHGAAKDLAYEVMNKTLKAYLLRIQAAADVSVLGNQIVIIQSCGCVVQGVGGKSEQVFDCFWGIASGSVMLIAPAGGHHSCHDWWYSLDNITWTRMPPTVDANTMKTELPVGHLAYFRQEIVRSEGGMGLSQTISIMVK
ncbi:MAG: hypothetical protein WCL14_04450, partial [Bacteroidota bacterium]